MKEWILPVLNGSGGRNTPIAGWCVVLATVIVRGILPAMAQTNDRTPETIVATAAFPTQSRIEIDSTTLNATDFNDHYTAIMQRTKLDAVDREISIVGIEIRNRLDTTVTTSLSDIGVYSGAVRLVPVLILFDGVGNGKLPSYQLIEDKEINLPAGGRLRMHLVFIIRPGEDIYIANASVYALFRHAPVDTLPFSVSIGRRVEAIEEKPKRNAFEKEDSPQFLIAPQVTPNSIFRVKHPSTPLLPDQSGLSEFLGERGRRGTDLIFLGAPQAITEGDFDYTSAIGYLEEFYATYQSHGEVERLVTWLPKYRVLFSVINERALFGVDVHGPMALPTGVAAALFFVGSRARELGIDKSHLAPLRYAEQEEGFSVECLGIYVAGAPQGNVIPLSLYKKSTNGSREDEPFKILEYVRPF